VTGNAITEITIYDVYGKQVQSVKTTSNTTVIDLSTLASGVYVALVVAEGKTNVARFIK